MSKDLHLRPATSEDMAHVQEIYALEVLGGVVSFELEPPDVNEMRRRFQVAREAGYPYLLASMGTRVAGYAYAGPYRPRPAYRFTVENSVYVAPWARRRGVASRLLEALISECQALPFRQMVAIIGDSDNAASIELHRKAGFRLVGTLRGVGYKFDRWLDTVIMQRALGPARATGLSPKRT
ncbi:MAG TPA: GNAT family N-acetyltransferase [Gammaproteobacteria bacterium]|nr:GNAT family N-acetyltransferase [Gammaproteobacteria bacterium]